ncbi:MAG TPA: hypothetical protein VKB88_05890 [Bryobacteraceae bacterium]|nr:hypothetical protein [Bryobacteraceae bacterium]
MADDKVEQAAAAGVGAGVGTAGGATVGVLELAATQGTVTGFSAGVVIGVGAAVGALAFFFGYKAFRHLVKPKTRAAAEQEASKAAGQ